MTIAITLRHYLDGQGICYDTLIHEPTSCAARSAVASGVGPESLAKAGDHQTLVHLTHDDFHRLMRTVPHARISSDDESCRSELHYFGA